MHREGILAQLTPLDVGALDPPLQAVLVHVLERAAAAAGRDQRLVRLHPAVADLAKVTVQTQRGRRRGEAVSSDGSRLDRGVVCRLSRDLSDASEVRLRSATA